MNETLKRTISGAVYIALLLTSILFSTESFIILFGIFLIIATYEFCNLVGINKVFSILFVSLFYSAVALISFYKTETENYISKTFKENIIITVDTEKLFSALLIITLIVSVKCIVFLFDDTQIISKTSKYIYLLGYVTLPFLFITKISFGIKDYNPKIIIGLFVLIWTNDTFAYLVGKSMGKHKLFERISPKKTIEGFLGGVVFAAFAGFLISKLYIQPKADFSTKSILIWMIIALIVSIFGTIGDLIESKFKRVAGVKDSGSIMPGHGGVLDRLDSVIFVAPIIFLFYQILYYVS
ncbi:phosphatidate cytidylyltransferase [Flavobacterium tructae]|uniref:Phosphatidate cytidylyltransferase n=1 Tax=Flavobacterium tructae TaxID=1114873 RepID=A0A1S1J6Z5_9FLAO|nr:phosphatidate cytidylyltransferase [Flavobacterium tructae]OHT45371.1 phosphatidate cytidylyltransferase [Flavobacterium tructae]OXB17685.1 phosphatidate cytidylyltransferase [Flavobacterium tructae]OXB23363.1 phosphatidate cytidylyltransferase [Flavobacterium tructae]